MSTNKKEGYGKILDAWTPPEGAGEPIGCVTTTFTFSAPFFEEECLGRFLALETTSDDDGPLYLVEREEKLSGAYVAALVDQHNCKGVRSLRWDLLSARIPKGVLHAKISLLYWNNVIRLIIGSANLTEDGYRKNQEIFGAVDYYRGGSAPISVLTDSIGFLKEVIRYTQLDIKKPLPAIARWNGFLERVLIASKGWGLKDEDLGRKEVKIGVVFVGPERESAFMQMSKLWESSPPERAYITSPFFDPPEAPNAPAHAIWGILKQRGKAEVTYNVSAEEIPGSKALLIHAPRSLLENVPHGRDKASVSFSRLSQIVRSDTGKDVARPLHLKSMWLENDVYALYVIGSSNFTTPGLGLSKTPNIEANLTYSANCRSSRKLYTMLGKAYLDGDKIDLETHPKWQEDAEANEDEAKETVVLPNFFRHAIYRISEKRQSIVTFYFGGTSPKDWLVKNQGQLTQVLNEEQWKKIGTPDEFDLPWIETAPPSGFEVSWKDAGGWAWLPVNIEKQSALPPPEELKNLSLDMLIDILTSAQPLHLTLKRWLKRQKGEKHTEGPIVDPLKRVDTSAFLLQRTRRVSDALYALRARLEKPVMTKESLEWRLYGPVGVEALARAISGEAKSEHEKSFLLTELILELSRAKPLTVFGALSAEHIKKAINGISKDIKARISLDALAEVPSLREYITSVFLELAI